MSRVPYRSASLLLLALKLVFRCIEMAGGSIAVAGRLGGAILIYVWITLYGGTEPHRPGLLKAGVREVLRHHVRHEHNVD